MSFSSLKSKIEMLILRNQQQKEIIKQFTERTLVEYEVPKGTKLGMYAFAKQSMLKKLILNEGLTEIPYAAITQCSSLESLEIPSSVLKIDNSACSYATKLASVVFKGTPTSIDVSTFRNCNNLLDIKVPWSEGEVANAPWGATNAVITYNYTNS